jgi:phage tail sheath protein FI
VVGQIERAIRTAGADVPALAGATAQLKNGLVIVRLGRGGYHPGASVRLAPTTGTPLVTLGYASATTTLAISSPQEYVLGAPAAWGTDVGGYVSATAALDAGLPSASALIGDPATKTGMYQLLDVDLFNILCIPAAAELATPTEISAVYTAAEMLCADERAFLIIDVPPSVRTLEAARQWTIDYSGLRHPNAAVYFPRVQVPDPTAGFALRTIGASGTVAGVFARTDAERGVWQAPAGVDAVLRGVDELDARLTDPENGVLNKLAVNCLRGFPAQGRIVWGARTLDGADDDVGDWKYIPVRRLALMIEESLYRGTRWAVFQPNDEPLWARLRQNVGAYMHRLFRQRAFQGATPREAYYVKCDRELNPPEDRELGIVTVEVGFAPLKPAEFVVIRIQQIAEMA